MEEFYNFYNYVNYSFWEDNSTWALVRYNAVYDPITNTTTVTFGTIDHRIWGERGTNVSATTVLTVAATDSNENVSVTVSSSGKISSSSTSEYGHVISGALATPSSIVVKHSNTAGEKSVVISASTTFYFEYKDSDGEVSGSTSMTISSASSGTSFEVYTLLINANNGSEVIVDRISSAVGESIGNLLNGASIYKGDVLHITFNANVGYILNTHTVNGFAFISGDTHNVSSDVVIVAISEQQGLVYIYNGSSWDAYQVYIDNGSSWDMYIPYLDNGNSWDICS